MKIAGSVFPRNDSKSKRWGAVLRVNGQRIRQEAHFETKSAAKAALQGWQNELLNGRYLDREREEITVATLIADHGAELARKGAKSLSSFDANSKAIRLGPKSKTTGQRSGGLGELPACALTSDAVDRFRDRCIEAGLAKATVDRAVETLRAALLFAVEKGKLARAPKLSFYRPNNRRTGFFAGDEHEAILANLRPALADFARFAHASGWRRGEGVGLRWENVDRQAGTITLEDSKNGDPRVLPYYRMKVLVDLIERRWAARQYEAAKGTAISSLVFHEDGRPIGDFRKAWRSACVAAGLGSFVEVVGKGGKKRKKYVGRLVHDYRRTAVSDLIDAGIDPYTAKAITGHRSDSVLERYKITKKDRQALALEKLEQFRAEEPRLPAVAKIGDGKAGG